MIQPEKIQLASINIFKANLQTAERFLDAPVRPKEIKFGLDKQIAHNFKDGRSRFRLFFQLTGVDEKSEELGVRVEYGIEFHFKVDNFDAFVQQKSTGAYQLDITLVATLLGMAYSTARGIIFERTRGTFFEGILLPVIDPYKSLLAKEMKAT